MKRKRKVEADSWRLEWLWEENYLTEDGTFKKTGVQGWKVDVENWPLDKIVEYLAFFKQQYEIERRYAAVHTRIVNNQTGEIIPGEIYG